LPDSLNWDDLPRFYDMNNPRGETVALRHLVNWVIHSFVFIPEARSDHAGSSTLTGFYCNSDRTRGRQVIRVDWVDYHDALSAVARDQVIELRTIRNGRGKEIQLRSNKHLTAEEVQIFYAEHEAFIAECWEEASGV
jgi:hypothetical protein